ncbi:MAG: hypothetical protein WCO10_03785 [bacterium]
MLKFSKQNNRREDKGFALLFAVLISSLLLSIGLSIFSVALRELSLSTAARQSVYAFYAADAGRECAMYWDIRQGKIQSLQAGSNGASTIYCNTPSPASVAVSSDHASCPTGGCLDPVVSTFTVNLNSGVEADYPQSSIKITKSWLNNDPGTGVIKTTYEADGYDSIAGNRLERTIVQTVNQ